MTFTSPGSPFTLGPSGRPSSGATFGESPGNVFGDPWGGDSNTTFTGSFGGSGWGSGNTAAGINLFSNFISAIGSLFGGGGGPGSAPASDPAPAPVSNPAPAPRPAVTITPPQSPPQQVADAGEMPDDVRDELENYFRLPQPTMTDRTGLDDLLREMTNARGSVTGPAPQPVTNQPGNINNPAPMPQDDFRGIEVPQPDPVPMPPSSPAPSRPLTRELATLEVERTREALQDRSWYGKMRDWLGLGSDEGIAYQRAQQQLRAASFREGLEKIAQEVRSLPAGIQVAEGGPVMTDAAPIDIGSLEKMLTPQQRAQFEREYDELVREFDAAQTDEERSAIINRKFDEIRAIDPAIDDVLKGTTFEINLETEIAAPASQPVLSPSRMLEGLSKLGERVRDAAQRAAENVVRAFTQVSDDPPQVSAPDTSLAEPLPEPEASPALEKPEPSPAPAPTPTPQPSQTASRSGSFLQGSLSILSALLGTVLNFFNDESSSPASAPVQPMQPAAAASITANPSSLNDGDTSELSWTSVGTISCVVVDSLLNVIKRGGTEGDLVSPALSASTRFGVICDIEEGKDKFVNEVLVRVNGDDSEPERLFAQSGRVSTAAPAGSSNSDDDGTTGVSGGQTSNPQPIDVRTCDPEQSMDTFIKCLCEAEPNPNGCSLVP